ncbi:hypothetical protein CRG98_023370 [Punica granatum]|uniref:Uncharacterized protein n=1 Tax=Punica granatum TaxID=22663 RepID=A0A2I0JJ00_PUNGR|nr:hypothetical protein CRG98_023370 [Punica granatum]
MQPKRGKLSAPHFGPPASYMRIPDQSPGYYSSPGNQRRTCGHGVMNNRRRDGSIRKAEESSRKGKQATNLRATGAGTTVLFITESSKHQKAPRDYRGQRTSFRRPFGTLRGFPMDVSVVANAFGESSRHIHRKQRSQRSPIASRHSRNTEKAPVTTNLSPKSSQTPAHSHVSVQPFPRPKPAKIIGKPPAEGAIRSRELLAVHTEPSDVPFLPTTSASRATTFKGFLTTLTLPCEEVVTVRGPINRAQPSFIRFSLTGFLTFLPNFLSHFRVCSGLGTFGSAHGHLDPPLRSPTNPTLHCTVTGASMPSHSPETAAAVPSPGSPTRNVQLESCDSHGRFPDSFPRASRLEIFPPRTSHGISRPSLEEFGRELPWTIRVRGAFFCLETDRFPCFIQFVTI